MSMEELRAMLPQTLPVVNGQSGKSESYAGVRVSDLRQKAGSRLRKETLHGYLLAKGTDGYWVLYSGEEIVCVVHTGEVVVATALDAQPLGAEGALKMVSTEDKKPERWVRNLTRLEWKTAAE